MVELASYRDEFPILATRTYLISASLGPLSLRSRSLAEQHLDLWARLGPEELWFDHGFPMLQRCREMFASMIGADPDEIAVVPSISNALSSIATCLDFEARPTIVASAMDFPSNHYVWLAQSKRGGKLDVAPSHDGVRIETQEMVSRISESTSLVSVNRVLFESSYILEMAPIVAAAHEHGALVVVDDFHGSGILPIDVHETGVDLLVSGALKWLCGGQGLAFLYCRRDLIERLTPTVVGWFGTEEPFKFQRAGLMLRTDARRFETGTYAMPQAFTAAGGLELILEVGVERIRAHNQRLTNETIEQADGLGLEVRSPREESCRGGLVRLRVPDGEERAAKVLHALFEADVVVDHRGDSIRIAPHFFNTEADIDRCFEELARVL